MRPSIEVHDALAGLLSYPGPGLAGRARAAAAVVGAECPSAGACLEDFAARIADLDAGALEELYAATFDNSQERALEVGWHVFGENYTRGAFLVRMRGLLRECGVTESGELPDHLHHVLAALGRCDEDYAGRLAHASVIPAARRVLEALRADENAWAPVLAAVVEVLGRHADAPWQAHSLDPAEVLPPLPPRPGPDDSPSCPAEHPQGMRCS